MEIWEDLSIVHSYILLASFASRGVHVGCGYVYRSSDVTTKGYDAVHKELLLMAKQFAY